MTIIPTNYDDVRLPIDPRKAEKLKNAKYVGEFCARNLDGWVNAPALLFWQETPPIEGYSNYFMLFIQGGTLYITHGKWAEDDFEFDAITDGEEVIWSRYRHDYRELQSGIGAIDGGREYTRCVVSDDPRLKRLRLAIKGADIVVVENV